MRFRGRIEDAFPLRGKMGLALMLTHMEGMPEKGMRVSIAGRDLNIVDVGRNTTDGKPVSTRDCLTGKAVPPYGSIFVDWLPPYPERTSLHRQWIEEQPE